MHTEKKLFTNNNLINLLIALFPLSLILGNLATNINIILICFLGFVIYKFDTFRIDKKKYQYLMYFFFLYLILITLISYLPLIANNIYRIHPNNPSSKDLYVEAIFKAFFFLRFLLLFFIINKLIEKSHFNIKIFFISCAFFSFIVALDIFIQISFGKNLLGNAIGGELMGEKLLTSLYRPTVFFGNEHIAGGYLQKFSLFFIFLVAFFKGSENKKYKYIYLSFLFFLIIILLINNRMPVLLFVFSFFIFLFFKRKFKTIIFAVLISSLIFITTYTISERLSENYNSFYSNVKKILFVSPKLFYYGDIEEVVTFGSGHIIVFNTGIQLWKKNKIFGNGIKSFRFNCAFGKNETCTTHPHNYIIEILLDVGVVGFILVGSIIFLSIYDYIKIYRKKLNFNSKLVSFPFFLIIVCEFFPIQSTGSFFTTNNASIIFLILPMLINSSKFNIGPNKPNK